MCWGAGILLSSGVVRAMVDVDGDLGWKLPFGLQWVWPIPLMAVAYFAPESPWNAFRRGNIVEAKRSLARLQATGADVETNVKAGLAYIEYTTNLEKAETESASYLECFKGINLRRTEIVSTNPSIISERPPTNTPTRTAWSGQPNICAATPSSATPSSSSNPPASQKSNPST